VKTSGYSKFGTQRPGATVGAFESALHNGVCDGAILRAKLNAANPEDTIEPFSWGYRNGYAIRFAPDDHPLAGGLLVGEDGPDERGARPSNGAPDGLHLAKQNANGTPDYHGWPDRFDFLPSSQAVFNPIGGTSDDLCVPDPTNKPSGCTGPCREPRRDIAQGGEPYRTRESAAGDTCRASHYSDRHRHRSRGEAQARAEPGGDVAVPEVSSRAEVALARAAYDAARSQQRLTS
jgi:hypothetical protein